MNDGREMEWNEAWQIVNRVNACVQMLFWPFIHFMLSLENKITEQGNRTRRVKYRWIVAGLGVRYGCMVCMKTFCVCYSVEWKKRLEKGRKESNCIATKCQTFHNLLDPIKQMYVHWNMGSIGSNWNDCVCVFLLADFLEPNDKKKHHHVHSINRRSMTVSAKFSFESLMNRLVKCFVGLFCRSIFGEWKQKEESVFGSNIMMLLSAWLVRRYPTTIIYQAAHQEHFLNFFLGYWWLTHDDWNGIRDMELFQVRVYSIMLKPTGILRSKKFRSKLQDLHIFIVFPFGNLLCVPVQ